MSKSIARPEQTTLKEALKQLFNTVANGVERFIKISLLTHCFTPKNGSDTTVPDTTVPDTTVPDTTVPEPLASQLTQKISSIGSTPVGSRASQPSGSANLFSPGSDKSSLEAVAFTNR
jgi:hypothetical protein